MLVGGSVGAKGLILLGLAQLPHKEHIRLDIFFLLVSVCKNSKQTALDMNLQIRYIHMAKLFTFGGHQ